MNTSGTQPSPQDIEINVRIVLTNNQEVEGTVFLLESHHSDSPLDALYHFLNKRRDEFYLFRQNDAQEMLLPLGKSAIFELTQDAEQRARSRYPSMDRLALYANAESRVSEVPLALTLTNGRVVEGELWFFDYDEPEQRNATSALNQDCRYVMLHGERSVSFVHRSSILKAVTAAQAAEAENKTGSGLYDVSFYQQDSVTNEEES